MSDSAEVVDLARVIVSEEIRRILRERWSGVLAMTQGEVTKGLYFVEGEIAFAASTVEEDRLGANLFRIGRITEEQFRAALSATSEPGRRIGQALIEAGVLTPGELAAAVTGQVERIVLSVLRWTSGVVQRRTMDRPIPADLALDLNTPRLLLLGARLFPDVERLEGALGGPESRLRKVVPRPFSYDQLEASPAERAVLAMCARETSLGDLLAMPHPRGRVVRAVYALVAGGMLEHDPAPTAVRPIVTPAPPPEPLAEFPVAPAPPRVPPPPELVPPPEVVPPPEIAPRRAGPPPRAGAPPRAPAACGRPAGSGDRAPVARSSGTSARPALFRGGALDPPVARRLGRAHIAARVGAASGPGFERGPVLGPRRASRPRHRREPGPGLPRPRSARRRRRGPHRDPAAAPGGERVPPPPRDDAGPRPRLPRGRGEALPRRAR